MKLKSLKIFHCFIVLFFISLNLFADKIQVTSTTVGTALSTASPGDTIIFANGTYTNQILNLSNSGTSVNPILFKAETLGGVVFNGPLSRIIITGDYWIIDGFKWDNVQPNSSDIVIYFNGANNNIFRNNTISNSGRITAGSKTGLIRLMKSSQNNILEYNRLDNLINVGIQVWAWDGDNLNTGNIIRHNYFTNHSSYEFIQLGQGGTSAFVDQHSVVESNLFENFNMKDPELISSKTSFNIIRHNTFRNCLSMVVLRTGQNSVVDGNWFFNSRGIRVHDKNHIIINNYIEGIPEISTTTDTEGIVLYCGNMVRPNTNGTHYPADSVLVANNTIRNHKNVHLLIGRNGSSWSEKPNAVTIKNNLVTNNVGTAIQNEASTNAIWIQNMVYPTGTGIAGNVGNVLITDPQLSLSGEIYKLQSGSTAIDNAAIEELVTNDIDGQPRGTSLDIGADEYSGANITYGPLDGTKVGPGIVQELKKYSLSTSVIGVGSIILDPSGGIYNASSVVTITATPGAGYQFNSWSGGVNGNTNSLSVTMNENKSITANFTPVSPILKIDTVWATADDGNVAANTLDNNLTTRWSAKDGPHSITFKLHSICNVDYLMIAWFSGNIRSSYFDIAVSKDGETWTTVLTGTSNGTTLQPEFVDIPDTPVRYVRYIGNGNSSNSWNSIAEFKIHGTIEIETAVEVLNKYSEETKLFQNYPNPFNTGTSIQFYLPTDGNVRLDIYNINDIKVVTLVNQYLQSGKHEIMWNAKEKGNRTIVPGVYFYQLNTPYCNQTKKMYYVEK